MARDARMDRLENALASLARAQGGIYLDIEKTARSPIAAAAGDTHGMH